MLASSPNTAESNIHGELPGASCYHPLVIVLVAVCAGIVVDRFMPMPVSAWWATAGAAWLLWLGCWLLARERLGAMLLLTAVAATAGSWHHCRWYLFKADDLGLFAGPRAQPVCMEAIALQSAREMPPPDPDPLRVIPSVDRCTLEVRPAGIRDGISWRSASGKARLLIDGHVAEVEAGDRLRVFGQLAAPAAAQNPGEFDYAAYYRADRLTSVVRVPGPECVSVLAPGPPWSPRRWIDRARCYGDRLLRQYLDQRHSPLAAAVLLGAREQLDPDQKQAFMETGTIHLLAISGLHVGILAGTLLWVVRRAPIPQGWGLLGVASFAVFYMLLTDARPPVVRATILVLVFCLAMYVRRRPPSFNSLAAAALVVLVLNPAELFHAGAQLSFLAVGGLMWFGPRWMAGVRDQDPLDRLIAESRSWPARLLRSLGSGGRRLLLCSAMIWLLTAPLVMARFHLLTPVAIVLNTVLWFPMAAALLAGFAAIVFGSLSTLLGQTCGRFCNACLACLQSTVGFGREVPFGRFWVPGPGGWWLAGLYGGIALAAMFPKLRPPRRWCLALAAGWTTIGFAAAGLRQNDARLDCTFLSVGHGCAAVLQLPSGRTILYDVGRFGSPVGATRSIAGFLWSQGLTHVDAVILSHADVDHFNALPGLLERFTVGVLYVSPMMFENSSPSLTALLQAVRQSGVPVRRIGEGDRLDGVGGCRIEVLHPPRGAVQQSDNSASIVLDVEYQGSHIVLPGDVEPPGLEDLLAKGRLDCDVLLAPHHGSRRSKPEGLDAWGSPQWVVISGGRRWDWRAVEAIYREQGAGVVHTAQSGAITVRVDATGLRIEQFAFSGK